MLMSDFWDEFKRVTETKWRERPINPNISGFQFQAGTRWNVGLSDDKIEEFKGLLGIHFPHDYRAFLRAMNGTDLPTLNVYAYCGEPPRQSVGVYSYPRDLELVRRLIEDVSKDRAELANTMAEEGFDLQPGAALVPVYGHRYLVCTPSLDSSVVLSIHGTDDAIVYGSSLKEYLEREFLADSL
jgi:SMI1/KNR4 family protein SUKH-1